MADPRYLKRNPSTGLVTDTAATSVGPAPSVVVATTPGGQIDPSLIPGTGATTATAGETLSAGNFVYVSASDGRLYNAVWAAGGSPAIGFVNAVWLAGQTATYFDGGVNGSLSSLSVGQRYYGDPGTAGAVTTTVPTGAGVLHQLIGTAGSATTLEVDIQDVIVLAS